MTIRYLEGKEKEIFDIVWDSVPETDDWERLQAEEDLIKRAIYETLHAISEHYISKEEVKKLITEMIIVIKSFTEKDTEGEEKLKEWIAEIQRLKL